jgi:hypothetical protein
VAALGYQSLNNIDRIESFTTEVTPDVDNSAQLGSRVRKHDGTQLELLNPS